MPPRGRKPPWWPADEPWPPTRPPWQVNRGAILWRLGFVLLALLLFVGGIGALSAHFWDSSWDNQDRKGPPVTVIILFWIIVIGTIVYVVRRVGRGVRPIFDLIDASYKVSDGDYAVRVSSNGNQQFQNLIQAFNSMTEKLEVNDQQRRRLLADIAHELRTPLAVIQGSVEGMIDGVYPLDAAQLEPLLRESQLITRLLNDLQTLSRAEAGALDLYREPTDLVILLGDIVGAYQQRATDAGVDLHLRPGAAIQELELDPMRIRQVIENLLTNALRHTPAGGMVEVTVSAESDQVRVAIRDTGSGIPAGLVPHIFDRFVKSADSGGSGLGLAIARRLIEAQGGTISASSEVGEGTEIQIRLPLGSAAGQ